MSPLAILMPHGFCYQWDPFIVHLHVISDALIALAYFAIPLGLIYFVRRRKDIAFGWMFACFAMFIIACGTTHLMEIWTVWHPSYIVSGWVKAVTAAASIPTAYLLIRKVVPAALLLPSPAQLRQANVDLREEVRVRQQAEQELAQKAEALEQSNRDLQQFAYVASHDLREPLRMVAGYCDLLREDVGDRLGPEAERYIQHATNGAKRMQALVDDLLLYSRISAQPLQLQPVDLNETITLVLDSLQVAVRETGATVTHGSLPTVGGEPTQLMQLFQNLVANALKFRSTEPVRVEIRARQEGAEQIVSVADNGIGIPAEYSLKIFQMFQRLHHQQAYAGTGIGLAVCHRIVERHQGRIWVESQPGQGSTFHVAFPLLHGSPTDSRPS